jgi:hypothetical protein
MSTTQNPDTYVRENKDRLRRIVKHGDDEWVRAMALAALVEYGDQPDVDQLRSEIDRMEELEE